MLLQTKFLSCHPPESIKALNATQGTNTYRDKLPTGLILLRYLSNFAGMKCLSYWLYVGSVKPVTQWLWTV